MAYPTVVMHDCNVQPPPVDSFDCTPEATSGEFVEIILTPTPFTSEEIADAEDFAARITETPDSATDAVRIKVTGKWTVTEPTTQEVEGDATISDGKYNYAVELDQFHDSDVAYNAARLLQYANKPIIAYLINDGKIYGGAANCEDGINTVIRVVTFKDGKGTTSKRTFKFSWKAKCDPQRLPFVLA